MRLLLLQIEDMARERHVLEACIGEMNTKGREVERWLAANEAKSPTGPLRCKGDCTASRLPACNTACCLRPHDGDRTLCVLRLTETGAMQCRAPFIANTIPRAKCGKLLSRADSQVAGAAQQRMLR